jgi:hypothetical protein
MPEPLTLQQLDNFLVQAGDRYPVQWIDSQLQDCCVSPKNQSFLGVLSSGCQHLQAS